uniref:NADH-ubiquinone oxidoreductase chain 4 n=1 Tax=Ludioschema sulcicolle TaxID=2803645 RepID=A0A7T8ZSA9_9COLE|nr:NADH dehydrogenase subunit 4 [Ludioschema sulcicolle]QQQ88051.1 NADH dehydrogenase subunit 4 [Ludioschema sulcicolle]
MKFIMFMIFMIPLCFLKSYIWLNQFIYFSLFFLFLLTFNFSSYFCGISYFLGCDFLSFFMILLSIWICSLMILASEKINGENYFFGFFLFVLLMLMLSLVLTFSSMNIFIFYLFFEISLIPTLILILGWGYQPERIQAGMYMFFYTLLASLPMMISVFYLYEKFNSLDFFFLLSWIDSVFLFICVNSVFLVKIPMFFVHLWLPKAHVEAPVSGSMILAGIMLKLGGYGFMRFMMIFTGIGVKINFFFVVISLFGGFIISLVCLRQSDMKSLIAYSSVSHMGLVLGGIMTMNSWGFYGALVMMVAHGLCSSGLFCLANITYERFGSRSLFLNKGLINLMPSMSLWWFLLCSSNMAAPPSFNLVGEIMLINSLVSWGLLTIVGIMLVSFFSASYSLYLYSYSQHGKLYQGSYSFSLGFTREYLLLFLHWLPLNLLFLKSDIFIF